jgi:hypothetical protein
MKALIVTPAYSHTHPALDDAVRASGLPWLKLHNHSDLPRVRSVLLERALEVGAERVILVDADTIPVAGALEALADGPDVTSNQAVFGLYPLREGREWSVNPEDADAASEAIAKGNAFRIRTRLGLCAIHRESLERVAARLPVITDDRGPPWHPFCVPIVRDSTYYADDGSICIRLAESGTELWCNPTLRAGHAVERIITSLQG